MIRTAASKVMWVGRATVFLVGLAVIAGLVFGVTSVAFGTDGDFFTIGQPNTAESTSTLDKAGAGPALNLKVDSGAPIKVNSTTRVAKLNADQLDGMSASDLEEPRGYAQVNVTVATVTLANSKGIGGVQRSTTDSSVYCFDLTFVPKVAVASAHINNNATVGTVLGSGVPASCPTGFTDAAAKTYAANTSGSVSDVNFGIVFI